MVEQSPCVKYRVPVAKTLKEKWKQVKPSIEEKKAFEHPQKHPLALSSTIIDAIIHFTFSRPKTRVEKDGVGPMDIRYPYILEEASRLTSKEATELLHNQSTQELRQAIVQTIESFGLQGFTWKWHDEFKSSDKYKGLLEQKKEKEDLEKKEKVDVLLAQMMEVDEVKKVIGTSPSMYSQVQEILAAAAKVSDYCNPTTSINTLLSI